MEQEGGIGSDETISTRGKVFHCDLCDVKITSAKAVQDHLQGKKHQRLTLIQTTRQKEAECSIFVGGLTKLVSELELTDYFTKYGGVAQVIVDKDKGKYAIVQFSEKETAERASEEEKQLMNGKKITVRPRENKPFAIKSKHHSPPGKGAQGKTAKEMEMDVVLEKLLESENVSCQLQTLMEETCLAPSDLQLRYLICDLLQEVFIEMFPKCRVYPYGSSVSSFGVKGCDLDLQIDLGRGDETFAYQFASLPGSSETSMETTAEVISPSSSQDQQTSDEPRPEDLSGNAALEVLCRLLKECVPSCQHVRAIPSSRRPVIKFRHKESGLLCDLSMDNRLALRNTELLHFYSSLDPRVAPLTFGIRLWARQRQLAGNQGPGPLLTNYALTLMVVHYLQNTQPPILPTVHQLRAQTGPADVVNIDGWDCSFVTDATKIGQSDNTENAESLMKGFFSFYTKCDFTTSVLCPVSGKTVPLTQFLKDPGEGGPVDSPQEFKVSPVNIQDPLELSHNVAMNVNDKTGSRLREELRAANLTCISLRYRKQGADAQTGEIPKWGLLSLVEEVDTASKKKESSSGKSPAVAFPMKVNLLTDKFVKTHSDEGAMKRAWCQEVENFLMQLLTDVLLIESGESSSSPRSGSKRDYNHALGTGEAGEGVMEDSGLVNDLHDSEEEGPLRKRLKVDPPVDDDDQNNVSMSSAENTSFTSTEGLTSPPISDSPGEDSDGSIFRRQVWCKSHHAVWVGRRRLRRKLQLEKVWGDAPVDEISRERRISAELAKGPSQPDMAIEFKLELRHRLALDSTAVVLTFHPVQNEAGIRDFAHFFDMFGSRMLTHLQL
ncbi:speckle targeted PIP5K1A-regulated poly(A) polymerase-like [Diadema antillarum]|uniref:speckle targeted PIP5K1A-regulated poly(A) polymerase-like n=1 Tax=Diadema antillarum TaxID=105358 RepID=UPI003A8C0D31